MKLLCAADLHLGRRPSRLHDQVTADGLLADALTPEAAWRALVDFALAERVQAVLLAGDLLDDENDFYGTFGDLQAGVERLIAGGVSVLAVSGNHDVTVLARLVKLVPDLRLLGEGGMWEVATVTHGDINVHVAGWSYPSSVVTHSPVPLVTEALSGLAPARVGGLLHCDRDQPTSHHAPVSSSELAAAPVDAWVLGHVHKPDFGAAPAHGGSARLSGYLGSISAADPGEEGPRGAWLLELTDDALTARHVPLAGLRYETLSVDVGELTSAADLETTVVTAVTGFVRALVDREPVGVVPLRAAAVRLRLVGRSGLRAELASRLRSHDPREVMVHVNGVHAFVHDVRLEALPAIDLAAVAKGRDPLALAARKLLLLDDASDPAHAALVDAARRELQATAAGKYYTALLGSGLPAIALSDDAVADRLRQAALTLIDAMAGS